MKRTCRPIKMFLLTGALIALSAPAAAQPQNSKSHPSLRNNPPPSQRPLAKVEKPHHAFYVHPLKGADQNNGSAKSPWRTLDHALREVRAGDVLYLRGGVYYENVALALHGSKNAPITIRAYPGERAILDGGMREFFDSPQVSWDPFANGGAGEYRSKKRYANLRDVLGSFGDSMIGLQTYYHAKDFRAANEIVDWQDWDDRDKSDLKPLYVGPGLWYNRDTGHIHIRLAHTHLPKSIPNYLGETDPRKLPLVIAAFRSTPLHIDGAKHIRLQDIIIRGAGYAAVQMDQGDDIEFDNVTVWCGTYGIRSMGTRHFRFTKSALYGNVAPWTFRGDGSKRDYPGRPHRNISRLNTHALLDINSGRESSVYATPYNDHWELAHSEFTDAHDGVYLGAINVHFHHNLIENMQDDGIYLSPMYYRHRLEKTDPKLYIHQNVIRQVLTALAFGGPQPVTRDTVFIYRNIVDLRAKVQTGRPSAKRAKPGFSTGNPFGDHGSPPWSAMNIYHNTFVMAGSSRSAGMGTMGHTKAGHPRNVFNNIFFHFGRLPGYFSPKATDKVVADGNLFWSPASDATVRERLFKRFRSSPLFAESKKLYLPGSSTNSVIADPLFRRAAINPDGKNDYRLQTKSPAINRGVIIPGDWPDPLQKADGDRRDIGALPAGTEPMVVGR